MRCVDPTSFAPNMTRTPRTSSSVMASVVIAVRESISRWYSTLDLSFADSRAAKILSRVTASAVPNVVYLVPPARALFLLLVRRLLLSTSRS
jgi:hypothetical protein